MQVDLSRLYKGIDLPETLSNLTGKRIRGSRRRTRTTKVEKILVLKKQADSLHTVNDGPVAVCDLRARKPKPANTRDRRLE